MVRQTAGSGSEGRGAVEAGGQEEGGSATLAGGAVEALAGLPGGLAADTARRKNRRGNGH